MFRRRVLLLLPLAASLAASTGCGSDPVLPDGRRLSAVLTRLESELPAERTAALAELAGLGALADPGVPDIERHLLGDAEPRVRAAAAHCLAAIGTAAARDKLLAALAELDPPSGADVAARAGAALQCVPDRAVAVLADRAATDPEGVVAALTPAENWQRLDASERAQLLAAVAGYRGTDRRTLLSLVERLGDPGTATPVEGAVEFLHHAHGQGLAVDRIARALAADGSDSAWSTFDRLANDGEVAARVPWITAAAGFARPAAAVDDALVVGFVIAHSAALAPLPVRRAACAALVEMLGPLGGPALDAARATLAERLGDADPGVSQHVLALLDQHLPADGTDAAAWQPVLIHAALHAADDAAATRVLTAARSLFAARAPDALLEAFELALPADRAAPPHWLDPVWRAVDATDGARTELRSRLRSRLLQDPRLPDGPRRAAALARQAQDLPAAPRRAAVTTAVLGQPPAAWPTPWVELLDPAEPDDAELLVRIAHGSADPTAARAAASRLLRTAPERATVPVRLGGASHLARLLPDRRLREADAADLPADLALLFLAPQAAGLRGLRIPAGRAVAWLDAEGRVLAIAAAADAAVPDPARAALVFPAGRVPDSGWSPGSQPLPDLGRWLPLAR